MKIIWPGLCAVATACNPVFGLDETVPVDAAFIDFDHDGVTDEQDNCPTIANADQADGDGDVYGDACDLCPTTASATNHDEDGDLVGDACDLCPGIEDFNDDTDEDGLGDICDPDKATKGNVRLAFETFVTMPPEWQASGIQWNALDDATAPMMTLPVTDGGLANTTLVTTPPFIATIGVDSFAAWTPSEKAGIEATVNGHKIRCQQDCQNSACAGEVFFDGMPYASTTPARPAPRSRLSLRLLSPMAVGCSWGSAALSVGLPGGVTATGPATISLIADPEIHVTYFEQVQ